MAPLKSQFILSNAQIGAISGIGISGFTIAIFALGPFVDALGMSRLMRFAALCHIGGLVTMVTANGYLGLYAGALILSLGNDTVGAVCNPLVATLYRDVLAICMCLTATIELGPNRWMSAILASGGIDGLIVLAYISGIMALLRFFAGGLIHKSGAALGGSGLFLFSYAHSTPMAFGAATLFAFFWPTMLGFTSERLPRSGSLGLALMGGIGMLAAAHIVPVMGAQADHYRELRFRRGRSDSPAPSCHRPRRTAEIISPNPQGTRHDPACPDPQRPDSCRGPHARRPRCRTHGSRQVPA